MAEKTVVVYVKRGTYGDIYVYDRDKNENITTVVTKADGTVVSSKTESTPPKYLTEICSNGFKDTFGFQPPAGVYTKLSITFTPPSPNVKKGKKASKKRR
jgi:hypothetical protein